MMEFRPGDANGMFFKTLAPGRGRYVRVYVFCYCFFMCVSFLSYLVCYYFGFGGAIKSCVYHPSKEVMSPPPRVCLTILRGAKKNFRRSNTPPPTHTRKLHGTLAATFQNVQTFNGKYSRHIRGCSPPENHVRGPVSSMFQM